MVRRGSLVCVGCASSFCAGLTGEGRSRTGRDIIELNLRDRPNVKFSGLEEMGNVSFRFKPREIA